MLVLSRKTNERILIGPEIRITIVRIGPCQVRVGIEAPEHLGIVREELLEPGDVPEPRGVIVEGLAALRAAGGQAWDEIADPEAFRDQVTGI